MMRISNLDEAAERRIPDGFLIRAPDPSEEF
jgi:hypothetical protein